MELRQRAHASRPQDCVSGSGEPRLQLRTHAGRWVCVRAASLHGASEAKTALVIEPVRRRELAPMIVGAYGLTRRESGVLSWVLRGRSNRQIVSALRISEYTVQALSGETQRT